MSISIIVAWNVIIIISTTDSCSHHVTYPFTEIIREDHGQILSPCFPKYYGSNVNYQWTIYNPGGSIFLHFNHFYLENSYNCTRDHVEIKDGSKQKEIGCGSTFHEKNFTATSGTMHIIFISDSDDSREYSFCAIFNANHTSGRDQSSEAVIRTTASIHPLVSTDATAAANHTSGRDQSSEAVSKITSLIHPLVSTDATATDSCSHHVTYPFTEIIREDHGQILSPCFPKYYGSNVNYQWTIYNPGGSIFLHFNHFYLENSYNCTRDHVEIKDGSKQKEIGCGSTFHEKNFTATSGTMHIIFISDSDDSREYSFCAIFNANHTSGRDQSSEAVSRTTGSIHPLVSTDATAAANHTSGRDQSSEAVSKITASIHPLVSTDATATDGNNLVYIIPAVVLAVLAGIGLLFITRRIITRTKGSRPIESQRSLGLENRHTTYTRHVPVEGNFSNIKIHLNSRRKHRAITPTG